MGNRRRKRTARQWARLWWGAVGIILLLARPFPAGAQDALAPTNPLAPKSEPSASDMLQNLLMGKLKAQQPKAPTVGGNSSATASSSTIGERLPRKAPATGKPAGDQAQAAAPTPKSSHLGRPPPRQAPDFHPLPRLKPAPPISASRTIQLPQPIPMP